MSKLPTQSVLKMFFFTISFVCVIFFGYELLERLWFVEHYPGLLNYFHIIRGIGTSLVVAGFITWYLSRIEPYESTRKIFLTTLDGTEDFSAKTRRRITTLFTEFRWIVTAVLILTLLVAFTVSRGVAWIHNFQGLVALAGVMFTVNLLFRFSKQYGWSYEAQLPYQIGVDFLFITVFLHYTGGVENPAYMLYFIHVILASIIFTQWRAFGFATMATMCLVGLAVLEYSGVIAHYEFLYFHAGQPDYYNNANYLFSVLFLFIVVTGVTAYLSSLVVQALRRYRDDLQAENRRSEQLLRKIYDVREEERERVSYELHDQIGQSLSALRLKLKQLDHSDETSFNESVSNVEDAVDDAIEDVRTLSHQLRPPALDDCGLPCAVEDYTEEVKENYGVDVDFEYIGMSHSENFSRPVDTAVYRVSQEALHNAAEHGDPDNISLILQQGGDQLQLLVEDDGLGFDEEKLSRNGRESLGLQGMKERIEQLDGQFTLETAPGEGTRVRAEIPLSDR